MRAISRKLEPELLLPFRIVQNPTKRCEQRGATNFILKHGRKNDWALVRASHFLHPIAPYISRTHNNRLDENRVS